MIGGKRPGAGRPKGTTKSAARRQNVNVRLSERELTVAQTLGGGNASEGIRKALMLAEVASA